MLSPCGLLPINTGNSGRFFPRKMLSLPASGFWEYPLKGEEDPRLSQVGSGTGFCLGQGCAKQPGGVFVGSEMINFGGFLPPPAQHELLSAEEDQGQDFALAKPTSWGFCGICGARK